MARTAIIIPYSRNDGSGFDIEIWHGMDKNKPGESISRTIKEKFTQRHITLLLAYLSIRKLTLEKSETANKLKLCDFLLWVDDCSIVHLDENRKINFIEIFREHTLVL